MRVFVVDDEKDAADVHRRLVKGAARRKKTGGLDVALRAANPGVDFAALRPGTVLVVPDHPDVAVDETEPALAPTVEHALDVLPDAVAAVRRGVKESAKRADRLRRVLDAPEVREAAGGDKALGADLGRAAEALAEDKRRAAEWADAVAAESDRWTEALRDLQRLGG
jgi:L-ascorbate metabolism protein UlaG (beta-lactamase superfamily)